MDSCCHTDTEKKPKFDYIFWVSGSIIAAAYLAALLFSSELNQIPYAGVFADSSFQLMNKMWWGLVAGIIFVGLLDRVPREFVISALGTQRGLKGILRATLAGVALDLCSHGILLVGMKLYERGASLAQTMAFLIASPWNSISLTLILWSLIGFKWMISFLLLSVVIAIISGLIFEKLVDKGILPQNPNKIDIPEGFRFFPEMKRQFKDVKFNLEFIKAVLSGGIKSSKMIMRWIFLGVVIAVSMRTFIAPEHFHAIFGPTLTGLAFTILAATIIEVCSEGSTPIAADILTRAGAVGNSFSFLMAGVSTDYTEIMALKETTKSWKIALFLPLVTLPQVIAIGWMLNNL